MRFLAGWALTVAALVFGPTGSALASTWAIQPTPTPAGATSSSLAAVSCAGATACVAVGDYVNASGVELTLAEAWDGTAWSIRTAASPAGAATSVLSGVSCTAATVCVAVGYYVNASGVDSTLVERWNGTGWLVQPSANPNGGGVLSAVSCIAATCTAVGRSGQNAPLAERWNGSTWVIQPTAHPTGGGSLWGVSCIAASACSAVGKSGNAALDERWDGSAWSIQATPNPVPVGVMLASSVLSGVSCSTTTGCAAVGDWTGWQCNNGKPTCNCLQLPYCRHRIATVAETSDGSGWAIQPSPSPGYTGSNMAGVSCVSTSACAAVGTMIGPAIGDALAEQWNGSTWSYQAPPTPSTGAALAGVSCTTATTCTAVGKTNASGTGTGLVERYS